MDDARSGKDTLGSLTLPSQVSYLQPRASEAKRDTATVDDEQFSNACDDVLGALDSMTMTDRIRVSADSPSIIKLLQACDAAYLHDCT